MQSGEQKIKSPQVKAVLSNVKFEQTQQGSMEKRLIVMLPYRLTVFFLTRFLSVPVNRHHPCHGSGNRSGFPAIYAIYVFVSSHAERCIHYGEP